MNDILKIIYQKAVCFEEDTIQMDMRINDEIEKYITLHREDFNNEDIEKIRDVVYLAVLISEEEAFWLGFKYAIKVLTALSEDL